MNKELKKQLRSMDLFSLEIDDEAKQYYESQGIDPSTVETHYSPGTHLILLTDTKKLEKMF